MAQLIQYNSPASAAPPAPFSFPNGFTGGMNISVMADMIGINQSPDMINTTYEGSALAKRLGFDRINAESWGAGAVQGMTLYTPPAGTETLIVAWGGKLWSITDDGTATSLMGTPATIANAVTNFFEMGDVLYAYNGTNYVQWTGTGTVTTVIGKVPEVVTDKNPDGTGGASNEEYNLFSCSWKETFSGTVGDTVYVLNMGGLSATPLKAWVDGVEKTETTHFTVDRTAGEITFGVAPGEGTNNVTIQAEITGLFDLTYITKSTAHTIYGGKSDTRLFLCGADSNTRYRSGLLDPTYFPQSSFELVGSDNEKLVGFGKMIDYLISFKENTIWYSYIDDTTSPNTFPTFPLNDEYGCIAARSIQPVQGGLLALSKEGVIFVTPSLVRGQLNTYVVSKNINGRNLVADGLLDNTLADLRSAHSYIYNDKYLLHVKDKVWVLDLKYTDLINKVYCWYPYDGVPGLAKCFIEKDNILHIGSNANGLVFKEISEEESNFKIYLDDGSEVEAWWTSPILFLGGRDWVCKYERISIFLKGGYCTDHTLTFITDQGVEDVTVRQQAGILHYSFINYACFNYGSDRPIFPESQTEKIGHKGEYFQFRIRNNTYNRGMVMLGCSIQYSHRKRVK